MTKFAPIAIVGRAVVLPGALSPEELWEALVAERDLVSSVPANRWGMSREDVLCNGPEDSDDRTWSDRGGYVRGFDDRFDPTGFAVPADEIAPLDPVFQWTLHTARAALRDAGHDQSDARTFGAVFGNLSFPSAGMAAFVQAHTIAAAEGFGADAIAEANIPTPTGVNRFNSGMPALLLERALGLGAGAFALDAACASSLYAIKLACDRLHDYSSDLMLAGAVNCADDLCIHLGFSALQALSRSGRSRPFHREADGLVPAEGCGFVALRRLDDAVRDGDTIHGIIRGVGLSNDGRGQGMLVPSESGQARAITRAFEVSGLAPRDISLLECHATGTQIGDATELRASEQIYNDHADLPIGSLKSNTGHLITAAGVAGLIKVIEAMRHEIRPASLHTDSPLDAFADSSFRLLSKAEPWDRSTTSDGVLRAGVSAFGFGGNNAHLLVEEPANAARLLSQSDAGPSNVRSNERANLPLAIVGIGITAATADGRSAFTEALLGQTSCLDESGQGRMREVSLRLKGLKFPPRDLKSALGQQLAIMGAADEALSDTSELSSQSTGIYIGMGTDVEAARFGVRWRLATHAKAWGCSQQWVEQAREWVGPVLDAAGVMGTMPNIVANRLNSQFNMAGPSFTVSAEQRSGWVALDVATRALRNHELDAALVGAVDLACNPIHQAAMDEVFGADFMVPGDAAVVLVIKRLEDAERLGDRVYAVLPGHRSATPESGPSGECESVDGLDSQHDRPDFRIGPGKDSLSLTHQFGHAHAASALVHVAASALLLHHRLLPSGQPLLASNRASGTGFPTGVGPRVIAVDVDAVGGIVPQSVLLAEASHHLAPNSIPVPRLHFYCGASRDEVLDCLNGGRETSFTDDQPVRLIIVAANETERSRRAQRAIQHITAGHPPGPGVHFRTAPIRGELAFVFTAAGAAYAGMGNDLIRAMPELLTPLSSNFPLRDVAGWIYDPQGTGDAPSPSDYLWGTSLLSQAHAQLSLSRLKLRPTLAIGYSSGESNSLFAFGVWSDMDAMRQEIDDSGMMEQELGVRFAAIGRAWGTQQADWAVWNVLAPVQEIRKLLADQDRVHLAIINTANDVVIAGDVARCDEIVTKIGRQRCLRVDYNLACHVPEVGQTFHQPWVDIHSRTVTPPDEIRFYSNGVGGSYQVSTANCASAITAQAENTLDFPATIEAAYADGARIFVEHGPAGACTKFIGEILGDRDVLCVQLDRRDKSIEQLFDAVAALLVAGVAVDHQALTERLATAESLSSKPSDQDEPTLSFTAHPTPIRIPPRSPSEDSLSYQFMSPAPTLPRTDWEVDSSVVAPTPVTHRPTEPVATSSALPVAPHPTVAAQPSAALQPHTSLQPTSMTTSSPRRESSVVEQALQQQFDTLTAMHQGFIQQQSAVHNQFLALRTEMLALIGAQSGSITYAAGPGDPAAGDPAAGDPSLAAGPDALVRASASPPSPVAAVSEADRLSISSNELGDAVVDRPIIGPVNGATSGATNGATNGATGGPTNGRLAAHPVANGSATIDPTRHHSPSSASLSPPPFTIKKRVGPQWNKEQLKIHSSGKISELFGPQFVDQDRFDLQCRMPEPPLLLADRVTGLDAKPGLLGTGTIWTETDVKAGDWYLNGGYMPTGFMIESGQADLMLISYMGIDLLNQGQRVYRLLGCTLTYHGDLPSPGETLEYEIRINGHAKHGDVRLFFFEYDCVVNGQRRLTVRDAQAGFFSYAELNDALGILWTPEQGRADLTDDARVDPPPVTCSKSAFSKQDLTAFSEGRSLDCFGVGYEWTETHTRTPKIQAGDQLFIDEVSLYDPTGGPWGRGFMRCETKVSADDWFFKGHFKNDPCMPGNFMVEACIEALSFYLAAAGHTVKRDGWRFQPLPDQPFDLKCRGEINPQTKHVSYEIHVEQMWDGPHPTVIGDVVGFVDGEAAFHAHRIGVELVPGWPLTTMTERYEGVIEPVPVATDSNGFRFDWKAMLSCAWGRPSEAFGSMYQVFDGTRQSPRLPGEPYHFISRITKIDGELDVCQAGMEIECEYDIPDDVWYFDSNGAATMPHAVLLEAALQPCGWVASAIGSVTKLDDDLMFRNLDGTGRVLRELTPTCGVLTTRVKITNVSVAGGMVIESFDVECFLGDTKVYEMDTVFGFFPPEAFENQVGLPIGEVHRAQIEKTDTVPIDLTQRPDQYCRGNVRLADPMLLMIDRVTHVANGGEAGLGLLQGEKDVDVSEWFFKAHFFQDPVQPGSLGIEALIQLLQFYMIDSGMAEGIDDGHFEPLMVDVPLTWKYRGQVTPKNSLISSVMEITEVGQDDVGPYVIGKGSLWVDGLRIYEATNMGMRIAAGTPSGPRSGRQATVRSGCDIARPAVEPSRPNRAVEFRPGANFSDRLRRFWNPRLATPNGWAGEDIVLGLINQYVNRVVVHDSATIDRLKGRPAIYLGNHQVQIESLIATNIIPAITDLPMTTMANAKHQHRWIGQLIEVLESYPGFKSFEQIVYFEQDKPESMFEIIKNIRAELSCGNRSFFVHTDGTRSRSCRDETQKCSSVFLDLALDLDLPIVPVRFTGGLPVQPITGKAEFPVGHGRQDYWIGEPIEAEQLRSLSLRDRVDCVVSAINRLGVAPAVEQPLSPDLEFARHVAERQHDSNTHEVFAAIWQILHQSSRVSDETRELRTAAASGTRAFDTQNPRGQWLGRLATLLVGPIDDASQSSESRQTAITINQSSHPHLKDHAVNGTPVIPVVYVLEWFARAANQFSDPRFQFHELNDLQVLKGLVADQFHSGGDMNLVINAKVIQQTETDKQVRLELTTAGSPRLHYRGTATLSITPPGDNGPAKPKPAETMKRNGKGAIESVPGWATSPTYGGVLFHGPAFQVIQPSANEGSLRAGKVVLSGVYDQGWPQESWVTDPAMLDGVLQLALLWTQHELDSASLPTSIQQVRLRRPPAAGGYQASLSGRGTTGSKATCDVIVTDTEGNVVAELIGIETHTLPKPK